MADYHTKLPRDGQTCCGGTMVAVAVPEANLLNTSKFDAWLDTVQGTENCERATSWVRMLQYHRETQVVSNAVFVLKTALSSGEIKDKASAMAKGVPLAENIRNSYTRMITLLLEHTTSPGEWGMIAAHEGASWPSQMGQPITALAKFLDNTTLASLEPPRQYQGDDRLIRNAVRTSLSRSSDKNIFKIQVSILSKAKLTAVAIQLVGGPLHDMAPVVDARTGKIHAQVYHAAIPIPVGVAQFEYFVTATLAGGVQLRSPSEGLQGVVVVT